ncbi:OprD family porin [Desulfovibrio sp. OttesenSCG-928-I05]|nr:OprD family porin [Desulfovibrio sp. OttesenSCG-928-I05]
MKHAVLRNSRARRAAVLAACLVAITLFLPTQATAMDDLAPPASEQASPAAFTTGTRFFDDADLSGGVYFFRRYRPRYDTEQGRYGPNLNHASLQANLDFSSGFIGGHIGADFGIFGSHDPFNKAAVDHEMGFVPWNDPWHPDWSKRSTDDGASIYKAALKAKAGPLWGRAGLLQPQGPGVLGVNWSFMPGTYRGINVGAEFGGLSLAAVWADAYKAPWFRELNDFRKNDDESRSPWLWSAGLRYDTTNNFSVELAYGESKNHLRNGHLKTQYAMEAAGGTLSFGYHLYAMNDSSDSGRANDNFDGIASQHFLFARLEKAPWTWRLEATYTRAPMSSPEHQGQFAYRLTDKNGSSKGAYDVWWDARSDWNADNEKAVFASVTRTLDDILPLPGLYAGIGAAIGFDGRGYGIAEHFKEWAFTADFGYVKPDGPFKGAFVKFHVTEYRNGTHKPSWTYHNGFQSERDFKCMVGIPFSL